MLHRREGTAPTAKKRANGSLSFSMLFLTRAQPVEQVAQRRSSEQRAFICVARKQKHRHASVLR